MCPMGSAPDVDGAPPLCRTQRATGQRARSPPTGPPTAAPGAAPPRVSSHMTQSPTGRPSSSTGTVLAHCPVHDTATTWPRRTAPSAWPVGWRRDEAHHSSASWTAPPPGAAGSAAQWCSLQATAPVSDTSPTLGPPVPEVDGEDEPVVGRAARASGRRRGCLLAVHHVGHHRLDELVGLVGHPPGHAAVDGPGLAAPRPRARGRRPRHRPGRRRRPRPPRPGSGAGSPPCAGRWGTAGR